MTAAPWEPEPHQCDDCRGAVRTNKPGTSPETRWTPDAQLVPAILFNPRSARTMADLRPGDRAWAVAGLELSGESAERTAERMGCSLRLIRAIRAEDITQMAKLIQKLESQHDADLRAARQDHALTQRELASTERENARLRAQLDQMRKARKSAPAAGKLPCGHERASFNIYVHDGREMCRECANKRAANYRANRKKAKSKGVRHAHV